jgi:hypothetical protein
MLPIFTLLNFYNYIIYLSKIKRKKSGFMILIDHNEGSVYES